MSLPSSSSSVLSTFEYLSFASFPFIWGIVSVMRECWWYKFCILVRSYLVPNYRVFRIPTITFSHSTHPDHHGRLRSRLKRWIQWRERDAHRRIFVLTVSGSGNGLCQYPDGDFVETSWIESEGLAGATTSGLVANFLSLPNLGTWIRSQPNIPKSDLPSMSYRRYGSFNMERLEFWEPCVVLSILVTYPDQVLELLNALYEHVRFQVIKPNQILACLDLFIFQMSWLRIDSQPPVERVLSRNSLVYVCLTALYRLHTTVNG